MLGKKLRATVIFFFLCWNISDTYNQETDFSSLKSKAGKICFLCHSDTQRHTNNQKSQSLCLVFYIP